MLNYSISKSLNQKTCYLATSQDLLVYIIETRSKCHTGSCQYNYCLQISNSEGIIELENNYLTLVDAQDGAEDYLTRLTVYSDIVEIEQPLMPE